MSTSLVLGNATIRSPMVVSPFIELISIEKTGRPGIEMVGEMACVGEFGMIGDVLGALRACFAEGCPSAGPVVRCGFLEVLFAFPFFSFLVFERVVFMVFFTFL